MRQHCYQCKRPAVASEERDPGGCEATGAESCVRVQIAHYSSEAWEAAREAKRLLDKVDILLGYAAVSAPMQTQIARASETLAGVFERLHRALGRQEP